MIGRTVQNQNKKVGGRSIRWVFCNPFDAEETVGRVALMFNRRETKERSGSFSKAKGMPMLAGENAPLMVASVKQAAKVVQTAFECENVAHGRSGNTSLAQVFATTF